MNDSPPTAEARREEAPHEAAPHEDQLRDEALPEQPPLDDQGTWLEHAEELPARPRKRILTPLPVALLLALMLACGFIAGVLVQKGQGGSSGGGNGLPSLRGASAPGGAATFTGGSAGGPSAGGPSAGGPSAGGAGAGGATVGQVAYVSKGALYVTTTEGNTVKVTAAAGSKVTRTVETRVRGIHPGETVMVSGTTNANGSISASSIRAGEAGGFGGATLFDAGATGKGSSGGSTGGPQLFGRE